MRTKSSQQQFVEQNAQSFSVRSRSELNIHSNDMTISAATVCAAHVKLEMVDHGVFSFIPRNIDFSFKSRTRNRRGKPQKIDRFLPAQNVKQKKKKTKRNGKIGRMFERMENNTTDHNRNVIIVQNYRNQRLNLWIGMSEWEWKRDICTENKMRKIHNTVHLVHRIQLIENIESEKMLWKRFELTNTGIGLHAWVGGMLKCCIAIRKSLSRYRQMKCIWFEWKTQIEFKPKLEIHSVPSATALGWESEFATYARDTFAEFHWYKQLFQFHLVVH